MLRHIIILIVLISTVSCASRSSLEKYGKDLDEIRDEVRKIRRLADGMNSELTYLKKSVNKANDDIDKQTADIKEQKLRQEKMREALSGIKESVVKLESENIPSKREELEGYKSEDEDKSFVVIKNDKDDVPHIHAEVAPNGDILNSNKLKAGEDINSKVGFGYAVKDGVILWGMPTKDSDVVEILVSWQQLVLLGKVKKGGITWWKVKTDDFEGFVNSKFVMVKIEKTVDKPEPAAK